MPYATNIVHEILFIMMLALTKLGQTANVGIMMVFKCIMPVTSKKMTFKRVNLCVAAEYYSENID
jgi:hypothetical protein